MKINALNFLKKFLFHRVFFIFIALTLQLLVLVAVIIRFNNSFTIYYGASILISTIAVLWIINNKSNLCLQNFLDNNGLGASYIWRFVLHFFWWNKLSNRAKKR